MLLNDIHPGLKVMWTTYDENKKPTIHKGIVDPREYWRYDGTKPHFISVLQEDSKHVFIWLLRIHTLSVAV